MLARNYKLPVVKKPHLAHPYLPQQQVHLHPYHSGTWMNKQVSGKKRAVLLNRAMYTLEQ